MVDIICFLCNPENLSSPSSALVSPISVLIHENSGLVKHLDPNASFDKADWREVYMVKRWWAKFPDPPDPSTLDQADEDNLQRDLLSIECAKTLNGDNLQCPSANSLSTSKEDERTEESGISRKVGYVDGSIDSITNHMSTNHSEELERAQKDEMPSSLRFWVTFLWAFSGRGFVVVIFLLYSGHKKTGSRTKHSRTRRRSFHAGFMEMNGRDRHSRGVDVPL